MEKVHAPRDANDTVTELNPPLATASSPSNPATPKDTAAQISSVDMTTSSVPDENATPKPQYMQGWSLYMLTASIWISLFLSTLETTIVSTSLVSIADSLSGFEERNWVVTAYFLTYTGTSVIVWPRNGPCNTLQVSWLFMPNWLASSGQRPCFSLL